MIISRIRRFYFQSLIPIVDYSGGMAECSCSQSGSGDCDIAALQQCFERLYSSPVPPISSSSTQQSAQNYRRSPLPYSLFPLQVTGTCSFLVIISTSRSISCMYQGSEEMVGNSGGGNVGRIRWEHDETLVDALGLQARYRVATPRREVAVKSTPAGSQ